LQQPNWIAGESNGRAHAPAASPSASIPLGVNVAPVMVLHIEALE
jgi:hypothetical protein